MEISEAKQIALESTGELLAPDYLVKRIEKDLRAIRAEFPEVAAVHHTQKWQPGKLMLHNVPPETLETINNSFCGPTQSEAIGKMFLITFNKPYNPEKLAQILKKDLGVQDARPEYTLAPPSTIRLITDPSEKNTYEFKKGHGDCIPGCKNHHNWVFATGPEANFVQLVEEDGEDLTFA